MPTKAHVHVSMYKCQYHEVSRVTRLSHASIFAVRVDRFCLLYLVALFLRARMSRGATWNVHSIVVELPIMPLVEPVIASNRAICAQLGFRITLTCTCQALSTRDISAS